MRPTEWIKLPILFSIFLLAVGCAKPPIQTTVINVPVDLVNISPTQIVVPPATSTEMVATIEAGDDARDALDIMTLYAVELHTYSEAVYEQLSICTVDNADMIDKLTKIKQFILLNQQAAPAN